MAVKLNWMVKDESRSQHPHSEDFSLFVSALVAGEALATTSRWLDATRDKYIFNTGSRLNGGEQGLKPELICFCLFVIKKALCGFCFSF